MGNSNISSLLLAAMATLPPATVSWMWSPPPSAMFMWLKCTKGHCQKGIKCSIKMAADVCSAKGVTCNELDSIAEWVTSFACSNNSVDSWASARLGGPLQQLALLRFW
uniref:Uncharacterized protein n=1 Tax=Arundo donax TaxID=35708 RepID=A0A0A8Y675_ARUDO